MWSNTDVVIGVGNRIRPYSNEVTLRQMLEGWRDLENQERLAQAIEELENYEGPEDCTTMVGLIDFIRDVLHQIAFERFGSQTGGNRFEWGAALVTADGNTQIFRDGIYTDGDRGRVSHDFSGLDLSTIVSVIHNHPRQGLAGANINLQNRYPSQDDWQAADRLVALGANPNVLSLTIIDPEGEARVFAYSSNATYRNLSDSQQNAGRNLPDEVPDNTVMRDGKCVTL